MTIHSYRTSCLTATVIIALCITAQPGCQNKQEKPPIRAIPVSVADSVRKAMPIELKTFGTVEAYATVSIRSHLTGDLWKVHIKPGQYVEGPKGNNLGMLLFTIDPRPFQAAYDKSKADLESSLASAKDARRRADELKRLYNAKAGAYDEMRTAEAIADALEAKVLSDRAALEQATLNLDYASIESPIDGRAGDVLVKEGNLVKANDDVLATITKISPIYVTFSAPQTYLSPIRERMAKSELEVLAEVKSHDKVERVDKGILTFVNNTVDASTGTIMLKATFQNASELLWPGQFVNVTLILGIQPDAIVVPAQAVQVGQNGQYVYVVGSDKKVQPCPVTVDRNVGDEVVISSGLMPGQTVVTDGQLRLSPGALVKIEQTIEKTAEASPQPVRVSPAASQPAEPPKAAVKPAKPAEIPVRQNADVASKPSPAVAPESRTAPASRPAPADDRTAPAGKPAPASQPASSVPPTQSDRQTPILRPAGGETRKPLDSDDPPAKK